MLTIDCDLPYYHTRFDKPKTRRWYHTFFGTTIVDAKLTLGVFLLCRENYTTTVDEESLNADKKNPERLVVRTNLFPHFLLLLSLSWNVKSTTKHESLPTYSKTILHLQNTKDFPFNTI